MNTDHALINTKPTSLRYAKDFITDARNRSVKEREKNTRALLVKTMKTI